MIKESIERRAVHNKVMYLNSFNYFRGLAIVFIVTGHCLYMSGWEIDRVVEKWLANMVLGGTALFVFISGFLFHHIYYPKFNYKKFMVTKVRNVLTPYLVLSGPLVLYSVLIKGTGPHSAYFFSETGGPFVSHVRSVFLYLWTGRILEAYWYIPFIMVVFVLSPLIVRFVGWPPLVRLFVMTVFFGVSLFLHRPVLNLSVVQSVIYFFPVYLLGIVISIHRETIYSSLKGREWQLLFLVVLLALIQALYYPYFGNSHKPPFESGLPDIMLIQKTALCLFFMVWLNRFENILIPLLNTLASASFAIYFIHPYILWAVQLVLNKRYPALVLLQGPGLWVVMTVVVITISLVIAKGIRLIFPSYSRLIIGW